MCHFRRLKYGCGHSDVIVTSKCRRTVAKVTRGAKLSPAEKWLDLKESGKLKLNFKHSDHPTLQVPACRPRVSLDLNMSSKCGVCLFQSQMEPWQARVASLEKDVAEARADWEADEGLLAKLENDLNEMNDQKGSEEWKCRRLFPTVRHLLPSKSSRLGERIDCGSPLRYELRPEDLVDDVDTQFSPVDEQGIPFTSFWEFFTDRYMWMGPQIDWNDAENSGCDSNSEDVKSRDGHEDTNSLVEDPPSQFFHYIKPDASILEGYLHLGDREQGLWRLTPKLSLHQPSVRAS